MHTVDKSNVTILDGKPELIGEASTMGFAVGEWPPFVTVVNDRAAGLLFMRAEELRAGGLFAGFKYRTVPDGGVTLTVLND